MKYHQTSSSSSILRLLALFVACSGSTFADAIIGDLTVSGSITSGTTTDGTELRLGGLVIAKGLYSGAPTLAPSDQGAGSRMLWYPGKAAFRAGGVTNSPFPPFAVGTYWNDSKIGIYSTAFGLNSTASGSYSTAIGSFARATGKGSFAVGHAASASGDGSTALGTATQAAGIYGSTALGYGTSSVGHGSTAMGLVTGAFGYASTAMGNYSIASGYASTAMGETKANAYFSTSLGRCNLGQGDPDVWRPADSLFEIGNGTPVIVTENGSSPEILSNALTVYKNGNMDVQGVVTCAPGGDIPMFTGN